jgi:hypothetical protein
MRIRNESDGRKGRDGRIRIGTERGRRNGVANDSH